MKVITEPTILEIYSVLPQFFFYLLFLFNRNHRFRKAELTLAISFVDFLLFFLSHLLCTLTYFAAPVKRNFANFNSFRKV